MAMATNNLQYTGEAAKAPLLEKLDPYLAWRKKEG